MILATTGALVVALTLGACDRTLRDLESALRDLELQFDAKDVPGGDRE